MAESVVVEQSSVSVVPGETGTCTVRIRNTGAVIDQFTLTVLGQPAAWTTVVPAALSLFPNADGTIELHFAPPRAPGVGSGPTPFGVRVVGSEDPDNPAVEEGEVDLLPYVDVNAKLTPRTTETKRKSRHEIILDNKGNTDVAVTLTVSDPDEQLAFGLDQTSVTVQAGQSAHVPLKVAANKGFARGSDKHRPFQVKALPEGGAYPLTLDGNLIQKPGMPRFVLPLVAAVIAIGLIAAVLPSLTKDGGKGNLQLASEDAPVTTTAAPVVEEAANPDDGPATAEEAQAAAAAELAANGKDPNAPAAVAAAGTGSAATPTTAAPPPPKGSNEATDSEPPPVTSVAAPPPAPTPTTTAAPPPGAPTTTAAATTTTAPRDVDMYYVIKQEDAGQAHYHAFTAGQTVGQSFKANAPLLTEAWLNLSGPNITFNIRKVGPGGAIVASSATTPIVQFGWTKVTFPRVPMTVGAVYYLEGVFSGSGYGYSWYSNTNDYADGDGFANGAAHGHDLNARVIGRTG
jgi:hypothetical protein